MKGRLKLSYVSTLCLAFTLAVAMPLIASAEGVRLILRSKLGKMAINEESPEMLPAIA